MTRRTLPILVFAFAILPLLSSCGTSKIVFDIITPAEVQLPGGIENTALANLVSLSIEDNLEGVSDLLKGRGELVNQVAAQGSISGLKKELQSNTNTLPEDIRITKEEVDSTSGQHELSWEVMDSICTVLGKETVIALKSFTSRTAIDYSGYDRKSEKNPLKVWSIDFAYNVSSDYIYIARLKVYVNIGWKIYHPSERMLILDRVYLDSLFIETNGMSKVEAERALPGIKNAIEDAGYIAGARFARRISPRRTTVERKYFTSGNDDFKQANNFVKMRYWERAAEFWRKNIENPKPKIAGSAMYNLALVSEMNGKLEEAIDQIESARKLYYHKLIEAYHQILNQRKSIREPIPDMQQ